MLILLVLYSGEKNTSCPAGDFYHILNSMDHPAVFFSITLMICMIMSYAIYYLSSPVLF